MGFVLVHGVLAQGNTADELDLNMQMLGEWTVVPKRGKVRPPKKVQAVTSSSEVRGSPSVECESRSSDGDRGTARAQVSVDNVLSVLAFQRCASRGGACFTVQERRCLGVNALFLPVPLPPFYRRIIWAQPFSWPLWKSR